MTILCYVFKTSLFPGILRTKIINLEGAQSRTHSGGKKRKLSDKHKVRLEMECRISSNTYLLSFEIVCELWYRPYLSQNASRYNKIIFRTSVYPHIQHKGWLAIAVCVKRKILSIFWNWIKNSIQYISPNESTSVCVFPNIHFHVRVEYILCIYTLYSI